MKVQYNNFLLALQIAWYLTGYQISSITDSTLCEPMKINRYLHSIPVGQSNRYQADTRHGYESSIASSPYGSFNYTFLSHFKLPYVWELKFVDNFPYPSS